MLVEYDMYIFRNYSLTRKEPTGMAQKYDICKSSTKWKFSIGPISQFIGTWR